MEEYNTPGLPPSVMSKASWQIFTSCDFLAWSHSLCSQEKPPVDFPVDCLVGKHTHPVIYYVLMQRPNALLHFNDINFTVFLYT